MTVKDIIKATEHPYASKDKHGKLLAGAAVGVGAGTEERVELLVDAGVDVLVVDTRPLGHSQGVLDRVKWVKQHYPQVQVIGGNIATATAALALVETVQTLLKSGSARVPFVRLALLPVSVFRRLQLFPTLPKLFRLRCSSDR